MNTQNYTWPGLASYTLEDSHLFYGRDMEKAELFRKVSNSPIVIIYGASGTGKTSLLQAGIAPQLIEQKLLPIFIRLSFPEKGQPITPLSGQLNEGLVKACRSHGISIKNLTHEYFTSRKGLLTAWEWVRTIELKKQNEHWQPVFIFDQFEEVFTLGKNVDGIDQLLTELGDFAEGFVPGEVSELLNSYTGELSDGFMEQNHKVIITLREDYLARLQGLKQVLPGATVRQNYFALCRLNGACAFEAVIKPAPNGVITPIVAEEIVRFVASASNSETSNVQKNILLEKLEVEPAILSLVCQQLDKKRIAKQETLITADFVKQSRDQILVDFYENGMALVGKTTRYYIEDRMLDAEGFRTSESEVNLSRQGILPDDIQQLIDQRLLHRVEHYQRTHLELSHDVLSGVVKQSRDQRYQREKEEQQKLDILKLKKQRRRTMAVAMVFALLAIGASFAVFIALKQTKVAKEKTIQANENKAEALRQANNANKNEVEALRQASIAKEQSRLAEVKEKEAFRQASIAKEQTKLAMDNEKEALRQTIIAQMQKDSAEVARQEAELQRVLAEKAKDEIENQKKIAEIQKDIAEKARVEAEFLKTEAEKAKTDALREQKKTKLALAQSYFERANTLIDDGEIVNGIPYIIGAIRLDSSNVGYRIRLNDIIQSSNFYLLDKSISRNDSEKIFIDYCLSGNSKYFALAERPFFWDSRSKYCIYLWDLDSGSMICELEWIKEKGTFTWNDQNVSLMFTDDNRYLVFNTISDKTIKVDVETGEIKEYNKTLSRKITIDYLDKEYFINGFNVGSIDSYDSNNYSFSSDDKYFVFYDGHKIKLLDIENKVIISSKDVNNVNRLIFLPDNKSFICFYGSYSRDENCYIQKYDLEFNESYRKPVGHKDLILSIDISPDGNYLATGSRDFTACIWDIPTGQAIINPIQHNGYVTKVKFSPDERYLLSLTGLGQNTVSIWYCHNGNKAFLSLPTNNRLIQSCDISSDGQKIITVENNKILIWKKLINNKKSYSTSVDLYNTKFYSLGKEYLIICGEKQRRENLGFYIVDIETGKHLSEFINFDYREISEFAIINEGNLLIAFNDKNKIIQAWNNKSYSPVNKSNVLIKGIDCHSVIHEGLRCNFPDNNCLGYKGTYIEIYEKSTGNIISKRMQHDTEISEWEYDNSGRFIITSSYYDFKSRIWDAITGEPVTEFFVNNISIPIQRGFLLNDYKKFAVVSDDFGFTNQLIFWNLFPKTSIKELDLCESIFGKKLHDGRIQSIDISSFNEYKDDLKKQNFLDSIILNNTTELDFDIINNYEKISFDEITDLLDKYNDNPIVLSTFSCKILELKNPTSFERNTAIYNSKLATGIAPDSWEVWLLRCRFLILTEKYQDAYSAYKKALQLSINANFDKRSYLLSIANGLLHENSFILAEGIFYEVLNLDSNTVNNKMNKENINNLASSYGSLSYIQILNKKFEDAIESAQKGIELRHSMIWINTNLALGYLLSSQYEKAEKIYLKYKDEAMPYSNFKVFKTACLEDFDFIEEHGITHPDIGKIRKLLN